MAESPLFIHEWKGAVGWGGGAKVKTKHKGKIYGDFRNTLQKLDAVSFVRSNNQDFETKRVVFKFHSIGSFSFDKLSKKNSQNTEGLEKKKKYKG